MTDFEYGAISAVLETWSTNHYGCSFHLGQCLWRRVQHLGLATLYVNNEKVKRYIKALQALAFVPLDSVVKAFHELDSRLGEVLEIDEK